MLLASLCVGGLAFAHYVGALGGCGLVGLTGAAWCASRACAGCGRQGKSKAGAERWRFCSNPTERALARKQTGGAAPSRAGLCGEPPAPPFEVPSLHPCLPATSDSDEDEEMGSGDEDGDLDPPRRVVIEDVTVRACWACWACRAVLLCCPASAAPSSTAPDSAAVL